MMNKNLIYCFGSHFSSEPNRAVFHHEKPHSDDAKEQREKPQQKISGVPIDVEDQKRGPSEKVLENGKLFHSNYTKHQPYVAEHPDKKATWRFLPLIPRRDPSTGKPGGPSQMEYRRLPEDKREAYLEKHKGIIQQEYQLDLSYWDRQSPLSKIPRLRPALIDRSELMVETPVYILGGTMGKGITDNFRGAKPEYVPGDDPTALLQNFEEVVKKVSPEKMKGASVVLTFEREFFAAPTTLEQCAEETKKLLTRLSELGIKTTVLSPLKTWQKPKNLMDPEQNRIRNKRNHFCVELAKMMADGLITAFVDLGDAAQANNTLGTNEALLVQGADRVMLNDQGIQMAVNGAIMGINAAHGYDGGSFSNERYWPGGEDYELGKTTMSGQPIERVVAGSPLVDKSLRDAALEKVKPKNPLDTLRRLDTELMGDELRSSSHDDLYKTYKAERFIPGMHVYAHPARKAVDEAFHALQEAKDAGKDVTDLTSEFTRLASSVYVKLARVAIIHARELFEDPQYFMYRREAYEHAKKNIENAEAANNFYHFYDSDIEGLRKEWEAFEKKWNRPGSIPKEYGMKFS